MLRKAPEEKKMKLREQKLAEGEIAEKVEDLGEVWKSVSEDVSKKETNSNKLAGRWPGIAQRALTQEGCSRTAPDRDERRGRAMDPTKKRQEDAEKSKRGKVRRGGTKTWRVRQRTDPLIGWHRPDWPLLFQKV